MMDDLQTTKHETQLDIHEEWDFFNAFSLSIHHTNLLEVEYECLQVKLQILLRMPLHQVGIMVPIQGHILFSLREK